MISIPEKVKNILACGDLSPLRVIAFLHRNKWNMDTNKYESENEGIDISNMIIQTGNLSMTLDVGEISQYAANNVTLKLSDVKNRFSADTPYSFFPRGYQLFGSVLMLYMGTDAANMVPIFHGAVKELPIFRPEQYQLDLRVVSVLELLDNIEAKDLSPITTGEILALDHKDPGENPFFKTANVGVGGFNGVYANGEKLFEGTDYALSQTDQLLLPALVEIINPIHHSKTITADYFCWPRGMSVQEIINGLLDLAPIIKERDVQPVRWNNSVRNELASPARMTIGYRREGMNYKSADAEAFNGSWFEGSFIQERTNIFPENFQIEFSSSPFKVSKYGKSFEYSIGEIEDVEQNKLKSGIVISVENISVGAIEIFEFSAKLVINRTVMQTVLLGRGHDIKITKIGNAWTIYLDGGNSAHFTFAYTAKDTASTEMVQSVIGGNIQDYTLSEIDQNGKEVAKLTAHGILFDPKHLESGDDYFAGFAAELSNYNIPYVLEYRTSNDGENWSGWFYTALERIPGTDSAYIQYRFTQHFGDVDVNNPRVIYYSSNLRLQFVNLAGQTVLDAIKDFALISGYEFGLDRFGVFFFRPRVDSTTPDYTLDGKELIKIDSVKKNLTNFFTKLTLTFAEIPLEFYANTGLRPTLVDKYGVLNKEIDKPQIVNYDNPELAQAIGPQLLSVYSDLPNIIQATGKLNLVLDLGDIVNLKRELPLTANPDGSDYSKYEKLNTYYRACKITELNYNFEKKQINYTLRDVSSSQNAPDYEFNEFVYNFPVEFGVKE